MNGDQTSQNDFIDVMDACEPVTGIFADQIKKRAFG